MAFYIVFDWGEGMTAIEYYNKYGKAIMDEIQNKPGQHSALQSFLDSFQNETVKILNSRIIRRDRAVVAVMMQQNRKWNDLCHIIEQHYRYTPIKRNAYWRIMKREIPGLEQAELERRAEKIDSG